MSFLNFSFGDGANSENPFEQDIIVEQQNADQADSNESAIEDLKGETAATAPRDESGKSSDDQIAESEPKTDEQKIESEKADAKAEEKPANPAADTAEEETADTATEPTIPTGEDFGKKHVREMKREVREEVERFLNEGRAAQIEAAELQRKVTETDSLINDFGGREILTEYRTVHEFLASLPPSGEDADAQIEYMTQADNVWETLTRQNETAAVQLAITGGLQFARHVPESRNTFLNAMYGDDLKLKTEAKGDNSQEDIDKYQIDSNRVLELLRLDALGFLPSDLEAYADDFGVRETAVQKEPGENSKETDPSDQQSKTPTGDTPAVSNSLAEFEKEFEETLPNRIETALQKGNFQDNPAVKKLVTLAVETIVRRSDDFKTVTDHLKAGNKYKDGNTIALPIKLHTKKVQNSAALNAETLVKELLDSLGNLPKAEPEEKTPVQKPMQPEHPREEYREPIRGADGGQRRYSSVEVSRKLSELNGGLG